MNSSLSENNCMMQGFGDSVDKNSGKQAFWKTNANLVPGSIKPVYGAQHPPKQEFMPSTPTKDLVGKNWPHRTSSSSSFQDFQESISDAWDIDDDDILMCSGNEIRLSHEVVQKAAMTVISNHSQQCKPSTSKVMSDTAKAQAMQRLATQRGIEPPHNTSGVPIGPGVGVRQGRSFKQSCVPISYKHSSHSSLPDRETAKLDKFKTLLEAPNTDLEELRSLSWSGIPKSVRPVAWRLLSGYLPANFERRNLTLERKREEYFNYVKQYYHTRLDDNHDTYRQIHIDIPRMCPLIPLFQQDVVQEIFERILFIWAIRHPASGYVQGINDLVTPFFVVFLSEFLDEAADVETFNVASLSSDSLNIIEADSFWCMSKLLDGIQDNYTFAQPGIQLKVNALRDLIQRIDEPLHQHLEKHSVEYLQFSFRWMNNLLMREIPLRCTIRLWDTYQSEPDGFASFHLYVCAAFLTRWSEQLLREKDFQGMMLLLQNLPTRLWSNEEIGLLLAEAYRLKYMFADAPKHLKTQTSVNSKKQST